MKVLHGIEDQGVLGVKAQVLQIIIHNVKRIIDLVRDSCSKQSY